MTTAPAEDINLGGASETPCFALLDGMVQDLETEELSRFNVPLTKLPAVLGRSHETEDPHFFGLGSRKALSRKQCVIYYRDAEGGRVEWDKNELVYKPPNASKNSSSNSQLLTPADKLPENGFFVVECLGRNRILVDKQRVEQGESVVLESGSAIRISSHMLYFLLPTDAPPKKHLSVTKSPGPKKNKSVKRKSSDAATESGPSSTPSSKKSKGIGLVAYTQELEKLPTEELLTLMSAAVASNQWDRKHQMIGTVIVLRAVKDAARHPTIIEYAKDNGVARSRIIEWIEKSAKYKQWVQQMLGKVEPRSYQAAITKSLLKAGYTRNGTSGRYVKWHLPPRDSDDEEEGSGEEQEQKSEAGSPSARDEDDQEDNESSEEGEDDADNNEEDDDDNEDDDDDDHDDDNDEEEVEDQAENDVEEDESEGEDNEDDDIEDDDDPENDAEDKTEETERDSADDSAAGVEDANDDDDAMEETADTNDEEKEDSTGDDAVMTDEKTNDD
eukprot:scaffold9264_cov123-Cylindrotheca_fusiformis.AAC.4